jgi:hypothetical protein
MGEERKAYKVLVGKPEGKRPFGRTMRRWKDGIKMNLGKIGWGGGGWSVFIWFLIGTDGGLL